MKFEDNSTMDITKDFLRTLDEKDVAELPITTEDYLQYCELISKDNL